MAQHIDMQLLRQKKAGMDLFVLHPQQRDEHELTLQTNYHGLQVTLTRLRAERAGRRVALNQITAPPAEAVKAAQYRAYQLRCLLLAIACQPLKVRGDFPLRVIDDTGAEFTLKKLELALQLAVGTEEPVQEGTWPRRVLAGLNCLLYTLGCEAGLWPSAEGDMTKIRSGTFEDQKTRLRLLAHSPVFHGVLLSLGIAMSASLNQQIIFEIVQNPLFLLRFSDQHPLSEWMKNENARRADLVAKMTRVPGEVVDAELLADIRAVEKALQKVEEELEQKAVQNFIDNLLV